MFLWHSQMINCPPRCRRSFSLALLFFPTFFLSPCSLLLLVSTLFFRLASLHFHCARALNEKDFPCRSPANEPTREPQSLFRVGEKSFSDRKCDLEMQCEMISSVFQRNAWSVRHILRRQSSNCMEKDSKQRSMTAVRAAAAQHMQCGISQIINRWNISHHSIWWRACPPPLNFTR